MLNLELGRAGRGGFAHVHTRRADVLPFSNDEILVPVGIDSRPHFWVEKVDYQERVYQEFLVGHIYDSVPITWPFRFKVDSDLVTSDGVTIEIATKYSGGLYEFNSLDGLSHSCPKQLLS
jgi:hypothetical protein